MSKHTKGPWKLERTCNVANEHGVGVASAGPMAGGAMTVSECEANARLIAAAPEMLEALKETQEYMALYVKRVGGLAHSFNEQLKRIIAKAEGGTK